MVGTGAAGRGGLTWADDLDGDWRVERLGGLLPPLLGVSKRIAGARGVTRVGPLPGAVFDVVGRELRYRLPLRGLVDVLQPASDGFVGRTLLFGRELGSFRMRRAGSR